MIYTYNFINYSYSSGYFKFSPTWTPPNTISRQPVESVKDCGSPMPKDRKPMLRRMINKIVCVKINSNPPTTTTKKDSTYNMIKMALPIAPYKKPKFLRSMWSRYSTGLICINSKIKSKEANNIMYTATNTLPVDSIPSIDSTLWYISEYISCKNWKRRVHRKNRRTYSDNRRYSHQYAQDQCNNSYQPLKC